MNTLAISNRGLSKANLLRFDDAIKDYDILISYDSKDYIGYFNRGIAKGEKGNFEGAFKDFEKATAHLKTK